MDDESNALIPDIEYPEAFKPTLSSLNDFFPDSVELDKDDGSIIFKGTLTQEQEIAGAYLRIVSEVSDVVENLNLAIRDLRTLARVPPLSPSEGERRYMLLGKVFFYELLRIRDGVARHLKRIEKAGLMTKDERWEARKLIEKQFEVHYLIRNVFLHGDRLPRSEEEQELLLIAMAHKAGYRPELRPLDGSPLKAYPNTLQKLAAKRAEALQKIGSDIVHFLQTLVNYTSLWVYENRFKSADSDSDRSGT